MYSWNLVVHLGKQNRTALDSLVLIQLRKDQYSISPRQSFRDSRVTTVHHLRNNETVGLPVDNMRRCLLSPYLYPLLELCRCYFQEQCPSEETRDVLTLKPTSFSINCLTDSRFISCLWHRSIFILYNVPLGYQWWKVGFEIQVVHHWHQWQTLSRSQPPESNKKKILNSK